MVELGLSGTDDVLKFHPDIEQKRNSDINQGP